MTNFQSYFSIFSLQKNQEPVGSKAPAIIGDAKRWLITQSTKVFVIPCQAQGHPVPAFR